MLKTYACFTVEDKRDPRSWSLSVSEVETRDIKALNFPKDTFSFYFFDAPATSRDIMEDAVNESPHYTLAEKIIPRKEAHAYAMRRKAFRDKYTSDRFFAAVWDVRLQKSTHMAETARHRFIGLSKGSTVLDADLKQIYPGHVRRKKDEPAVALEKAVRKHTVLQHDIPVAPPLRFKPRPPQSKR